MAVLDPLGSSHLRLFNCRSRLNAGTQRLVQRSPLRSVRTLWLESCRHRCRRVCYLSQLHHLVQIATTGWPFSDLQSPISPRRLSLPRYLDPKSRPRDALARSSPPNQHTLTQQSRATTTPSSVAARQPNLAQHSLRTSKSGFACGREKTLARFLRNFPPPSSMHRWNHTTHTP